MINTTEIPLNPKHLEDMERFLDIREKTISVAPIIEGYKNTFGIDVKRYFGDLTEIYIYQDPRTGYRYYYPPVMGDSFFYEQLEKKRWYYMNDKWEHKLAEKLLKCGDLVLEVGCGYGAFLSKLKTNSIGLEINKKAVASAKEKGLNIIEKTIEEYAKDTSETFDFICAFQVLEHLADPYSFISYCLCVLRPNGKLFIAVPNNDSFIKRDKMGLLNHPPHHIGLWNAESLKGLAKIFGLKVKLYYEPLQKYHYDWYCNLLGIKGRVPMAIARRVLPFISSFIRGHSICAVFEK